MYTENVTTGGFAEVNETVAEHTTESARSNETGSLNTTDTDLSFDNHSLSADNDTLWLPGNMTLAEWRTCHGLSPDACKRYRMKLQILNEIIQSGGNNSQPAFVSFDVLFNLIMNRRAY